MKRFAILLSLTLTAFLVACSGVEVTVQNVSNEPLRDVELHTRSDVYALGTISPGDSVSKRITPKEDTDLALSHRDQPELTVGTYLTRGFVGSITLELDDDAITKVTDNITVP